MRTKAKTRRVGWYSNPPSITEHLAIRNLNGIPLGNKRLKVQFKQSRRRSWSEPGPIIEREAVASRAMEEVMGGYNKDVDVDVAVKGQEVDTNTATTNNNNTVAQANEDVSLMGEQIFKSSSASVGASATVASLTSNGYAYSSTSSSENNHLDRQKRDSSDSAARSSLTSSRGSGSSNSTFNVNEDALGNVTFSPPLVPRSSSSNSRPLASISDDFSARGSDTRSSGGSISVESSSSSNGVDCGGSFKTANQSC